jgi:hypothetical protein
MYNSNVLENFCFVGHEAIFSKPSLFGINWVGKVTRISEGKVALKEEEEEKRNQERK